ncbi:MAG: ABC transporter ATP-binding protein [Candidatus Omnitrophota bacterium]
MKLKISKLTKRFPSLRGEVVALNELSLEIHDKEFFILLGASGCGKTTLLNLIAGLDRPTEGDIFFGDSLAASAGNKICHSPKKRNVAFVFQSYALYPHLNVFENIAFPLRAAGTSKDTIKESVVKAAKTLQIQDLLKAKPAELSGGQCQRAAIARAIVREPNAFLLDEPLSNLDAQLRTSMRAELKSLQKALGITTVYVTHDQAEAMSLGDRIAVINQGKIEQVGTPKELYDTPANIFVGRFIGSPPMNFFKAYCTAELGMFYLLVSENKLKASQRIAFDLSRMGEGALTLGIRPEDICVNPKGPNQPFKARVSYIEPMGKEFVVQLIFGEQKILALSNDRNLCVGDIVNIELNLESAHIFKEQL